MKQEDTDIKAYFSKLKKMEAENLTIPAFTMPTKKSKRQVYRYAVPLAIAASLILYFAVPLTNATAIENDTLLITLTEDKSITTDNLIVDDTSVSSWKSPTQILLQEFED